MVSGFYQVDTDELAVVTTFGKYDSVKRPGLHWHVPFPVQNARLEKVTTVRPTIIPDEATARRAGSLEGLMLTGDKNIVDVDIQVQWKIKEDLQSTDDGVLPPVAQFIFNIDDPEKVVRTVGEAAIREVVGRHPLEFIQTAGRDEIQAQTRTLMQEAFDLYRSGIEVRSVNILNTDPPTEEVNAAFLDVEAAKQNRENSINEARAYANRVIPEARGEAQRILEGSRGYAARVTAEARGQSARFEAILAEYQSAPDVTRRRMYLETVEKILRGKTKVIIDEEAAGGVVPYLPLNELQRGQTQRNQGGGQ
nr:FtsH protease activity modulator HflK [Amphiplicatus metriothermophilus]